MIRIKVLHYLTVAGKTPFQRWLVRLRDTPGRLAIQRRIDRFASGQLGNHKPLRGGVWELRVDTGPGYRVYFGWADSFSIVLLTAGDKGSQQMDIDRAIRYWNDFRDRYK